MGRKRATKKAPTDVNRRGKNKPDATKGRVRWIKRRALKIVQNKDHALYIFCLTGEEVLSISDISKLGRGKSGKLIGYQRPEIRRHINEIAEYINSDGIIFPNSIILALSSRVKFTSSRGPNVGDGYAFGGQISLPLPRSGEPSPGWIVDGQQRVMAVSKSKNPALPLAICAFVTDSIEIQRDQFLRVNNARPLPRGLITELLPEVYSPLPAKLAARRLPSAICDNLNRDKGSPFCGLIRRASTAKENRLKAVIADTSIIAMLQDSLNAASGCLFPYRNLATGEIDSDNIWRILISYWSAVKNVFGEAWGKPPTKSRLMHGAGIRAMGRLMDRVIPSIDLQSDQIVENIEAELRLIAPFCRWTEGRWEELGDMHWKDVQNVPRHIRVLSNHLLRTYLLQRSGGR